MTIIYVRILSKIWAKQTVVRNMSRPLQINIQRIKCDYQETTYMYRKVYYQPIYVASHGNYHGILQTSHGKFHDSEYPDILCNQTEVDIVGFGFQNTQYNLNHIVIIMFLYLSTTLLSVPLNVHSPSLLLIAMGFYTVSHGQFHDKEYSVIHYGINSTDIMGCCAPVHAVTTITW